MQCVTGCRVLMLFILILSRAIVCTSVTGSACGGADQQAGTRWNRSLHAAPQKGLCCQQCPTCRTVE